MSETSKSRLRRWCAALLVLAGISTPIVLRLLNKPDNNVVPTQPKPSDPGVSAIQERIDTLVTRLRGESLQDSMDRMDDIDAFIWPGYRGEMPVLSFRFPLPSDHGLHDVEAVLSNRRWVKVLHELKKMPQVQAAELVNRRLAQAIESYNQLYDAYVVKMAPHFKPVPLDNTPGAVLGSGPGFQITGNADGSPTLQGARYEVLALILHASALELKASAETIVDVAQRARDQYQDVVADETTSIIYRVTMAWGALLYHRQLLAGALLKTSSNSEKLDALAQKLRDRWKTQKLTEFDGAATPFDSHSRIGIVPVDYPANPLEVEFLQSLNDAEFDEILAAATNVGD